MYELGVVHRNIQRTERSIADALARFFVPRPMKPWVVSA